MKLLLSIFMLISSTAVTYPVNTALSVITDYAYVYSAPNFSSSHVKTNENVDLKLEHGDSVTIYSEELYNNQFYRITCIKDNIKYGDTSDCYVFSECVAKLEKEQDIVLTYNGETSIETIVYSLDNGSDENVEIARLDKQTQIYLYEGYNRKAEWTNIKFSYDGKIMLGKIKTEDIKPYGINNVLIISVTAIFACVSVIFILLGINKKSLRKKAPIKNQ